MKTLRVTTKAGNVYIITEATAFGTRGVIGKDASIDNELRHFFFKDYAKVEDITSPN